MSPLREKPYQTNKGGMHPPLVNLPGAGMAAANPHKSAPVCIARLRAIGSGIEVFAIRSAILCVFLLLAGCASIERQSAPAAPLGEGFHLSGRVSVKYGTDAASGRIDWQHDAASDDLLLSNPLGQGVARIVRRDARVRLTDAEQKVHEAGDVEALTEQVLGWRLPLAGLPDWVRGRPAAGAPAQTRLDGSQRLAELRQSGWLIEYLDYNSANGLPARLRLSRDSVAIRLAVDEWRANP